MKLLITFILVFTLNIIANDDFEDAFDNEFEQDLAMESNKQTVFDPLSSYNRFMTNVNDKLMINVVEPISSGYRFVAPHPLRESIYNFFENINYPVSLANNLLQLKFYHSWNESLRFFTNSTLGLFGFFDVADSWFEIKAHKEDFGQTLGHYGVGSGFPIVIPFFGQQNFRDFLGGFADNSVNPTYHLTLEINDDMVSLGTYLMIRGYKDINEYSLSDISYEELTKGSIDLYPFIRDAYEQNRNKLIEE